MTAPELLLSATLQPERSKRKATGQSSAAAQPVDEPDTPAKRPKVAADSERRFACDQCDYRCTTNSYLRTHQRTHTGEKPFACDQCDYRCTQSGALRYHLMMHTGEKPFACDQCDYRSTQNSNLRAHLRTHSARRL